MDRFCDNCETLMTWNEGVLECENCLETAEVGEDEVLYFKDYSKTAASTGPNKHIMHDMTLPVYSLLCPGCSDRKAGEAPVPREAKAVLVDQEKMVYQFTCLTCGTQFTNEK